MTVDIKKHEMLAQVIENRMTIHQDFSANQFCSTIIDNCGAAWLIINLLIINCQLSVSLRLCVQ